MLKKQLRAHYLSQRKQLSEETIASASIEIANKLLSIPIWSFSNYHLFLPIREQQEIDTTPLLSILQGKDKNVILPKVVDHQNLKHYLLTDQTVLKKSKWNIPEPLDGIAIAATQLDVVFIPLMAFDEQGNRVGYGKGYYDRFLKRCKPNVIKIGLSLFEATIITDVEENDIPLDYCVTPKKIYSFTPSS